MEQGGDGGGGLHHLGQPAVEREGSGLERGRRDDRGNGEGADEAEPGGGCGLRQGGEIERAVFAVEQPRRAGEHHVAREPHARKLGRGALRFRPVGVEQQQLLQRQPDREGGDDQGQQGPGLHEHQHRGERHRHQPVKRPLARLAVEVGAGIAHHDPADEADEARHAGRDEIAAQGEGEGRIEQGEARGGQECGLDQPGKREGEGGEGAKLGEARQGAGALAGPGERQQDDRHQRQRAEHGESEGIGHDRALRQRGSVGALPIRGWTKLKKIHILHSIIQFNRTI